ncbi:pimeloyl-ACP methyl ester carboxylesterase [Actinocorallia herbida]|uniref:Pimeloyl-ACP methyl ester carboxylesterase n=1 Tax=Actinocorallia herbida TaxID=58109 RepID=A0A3N1D2I5_9ACTN|nr:alpha/beta hydrolase [Actinocorallia herbida]ROO87744.1 pimeloyl-ACP methyl ester carboxylesterase [Actinocorallia herbida]
MLFVTAGYEDGAPIRIAYRDQGNGRPVVLVHGYPLDSRTWDRLTPVLLAAGHRVITYDRRGFGASTRTAGGYDYDAFAADLAALLTELDLRDAVLVSHGSGSGDIVRHLHSLGCGRAAGAAFLAGLGPHLLLTERNPHGLGLGRFDQIISDALRDSDAHLHEIRRDYFSAIEHEGGRLAPEEFDAFLTIAASVSPQVHSAIVPSWITDFRGDYAALTVPVLIVHGTDDRLLPLRGTAVPLYELLPRARYLEIPDAPHGLHWTHTAELATALLGFLARLDG